MNLRAFAFTLSLVTVFAAPASAQRRPPAAPIERGSAEAAAKKKDGDEAFRALRYADALSAYEASYRLQPNPALHFNRGRSLEALERYAEAVDAFDAFLREAPPALRAKAGNLAEHLDELRRKVATVSFVVKPNGARILLRDVAIGTAPLSAPVRVNAGPARIEVEAEGYLTTSKQIELQGGSEAKIAIELAPKPEDATAKRADAITDTHATTSNAATTASPDTKKPSVLSRWWFWTGVVVVVGGAAAVTYVLTRPAEPRQGDIGQLNAPLLRF